MNIQTKSQTAALMVVAVVAFTVGSLASSVKSDASFKDLAGVMGTKLCGGGR